MRVISRKRIREFWQVRPDSEGALRAWHAEAKVARWRHPAEVKARYGSASILGSGRVVFNICGNKYRLIVRIIYAHGVVYVRFVGTHAEYDRVDAETV